MTTQLVREVIIESLRRFKSLRDAVLHEDADEFQHHVLRLVKFCETDPFIMSVLRPILEDWPENSQNWWRSFAGREPGIDAVSFPDDPAQELALRFKVIQDIARETYDVHAFGLAIGEYKLDEAIARFRSIVVRPLCEELTSRLSDAAQIASPETRALQAVPPHLIPGEREIRLFLSHKSEDKPLVVRYHRALTELGFSPWLDEPELHAGKNLERSLLQGFEESCAAVFFITENFKDQGYLSTEVDYAMQQKREKGEKFSIITLVFPGAVAIPGLLKSYVFKNVTNDLDGLYEIVRALPVELGPIRWKQRTVSGV